MLKLTSGCVEALCSENSLESRCKVAQHYKDTCTEAGITDLTLPQECTQPTLSIVTTDASKMTAPSERATMNSNATSFTYKPQKTSDAQTTKDGVATINSNVTNFTYKPQETSDTQTTKDGVATMNSNVSNFTYKPQQKSDTQTTKDGVATMNSNVSNFTYKPQQKSDTQTTKDGVATEVTKESKKTKEVATEPLVVTTASRIEVTDKNSEIPLITTDIASTTVRVCSFFLCTHVRLYNSEGLNIHNFFAHMKYKSLRYV